MPSSCTAGMLLRQRCPRVSLYHSEFEHSPWTTRSCDLIYNYPSKYLKKKMNAVSSIHSYLQTFRGWSESDRLEAHLSPAALRYLEVTTQIIEALSDGRPMPDVNLHLTQMGEMAGEDALHWFSCAGAVWDVLSDFGLDEGVLADGMARLEAEAHRHPLPYLFAALTWRAHTDVHGRLARAPLSAELIIHYVRYITAFAQFTDGRYIGEIDNQMDAWLEYAIENGSNKIAHIIQKIIMKDNSRITKFLRMLSTLDPHQILSHVNLLDAIFEREEWIGDVTAVCMRLADLPNSPDLAKANVWLIGRRCLQSLWLAHPESLVSASVMGGLDRDGFWLDDCQRMATEVLSDKLKQIGTGEGGAPAADFLMVYGAMLTRNRCRALASALPEIGIARQRGLPPALVLADVLAQHGYNKHATAVDIISGDPSIKRPAEGMPPTAEAISWALNMTNLAVMEPRRVMRLVMAIAQWYDAPTAREIVTTGRLYGISLLDAATIGDPTGLLEHFVRGTKPPDWLRSLYDVMGDDHRAIIVSFVRHGINKATVSKGDRALLRQWFMNATGETFGTSPVNMDEALRMWATADVYLPIGLRTTLLGRDVYGLPILLRETVSAPSGREIDDEGMRFITLALRDGHEPAAVALGVAALLRHSPVVYTRHPLVYALAQLRPRPDKPMFKLYTLLARIYRSVCADTGISEAAMMCALHGADERRVDYLSAPNPLSYGMSVPVADGVQEILARIARQRATSASSAVGAGLSA